PMVIRIPYGGGVGGVEHHCDSSESYYAHTSGLHVVTPTGASDAYWLLREASASDDPVVFMEPKRHYWDSEDVDLENPAAASGRAKIRRDGTDATLISYGPGIHTALEAADIAASQGRELQVVDVRSPVPFDDTTVCA